VLQREVLQREGTLLLGGARVLPCLLSLHQICR
jgi:hypothetical protein